MKSLNLDKIIHAKLQSVYSPIDPNDKGTHLDIKLKLERSAKIRLLHGKVLQAITRSKKANSDSYKQLINKNTIK